MGVENPIVTRTSSRSINHTFVAVYDALMPDQIRGTHSSLTFSLSHVLSFSLSFALCGWPLSLALFLTFSLSLSRSLCVAGLSQLAVLFYTSKQL